VGQYESVSLKAVEGPDRPQLLRLHGMIPGDIKLVPRPTPLPSDLRDWLNTFVRGTFFASFGDEDTEVSLSEVEEMCRPDAYWSLDNPGMGMKPDEGIGALQESSTYGWEIMYVRLRGIAKRKVDGQT